MKREAAGNVKNQISSGRMGQASTRGQVEASFKANNSGPGSKSSPRSGKSWQVKGRGVRSKGRASGSVCFLWGVLEIRWKRDAMQ